MTSRNRSLQDILERDSRYSLEAYQFVRESLGYAQEVLLMGQSRGDESSEEAHLTGQQLCEAIRIYALDQYGFMAKTVLNTWGIKATSDVGEIVYNMIAVKMFTKSPNDRREDFDDVYDFDEVFQKGFEITMPE